MEINIKLNGVDTKFSVEPAEYLAETLRKHGIVSVKTGCNETSCGSCTVLLDGRPILSCSFLSVRANGRSVTTVDGIQEEASLIADYFAKEGADQCGYCNSGFALIIHALKEEYGHPTEEQIKKYIVGNLCRCTGYQSQLKAIKAYLEAAK